MGETNIHVAAQQMGLKPGKLIFRCLISPFYRFYVLLYPFSNPLKLNPTLQQCGGQGGTRKERSAGGRLPGHSPLQRAHHRHGRALGWHTYGYSARGDSSIKVWEPPISTYVHIAPLDVFTCFWKLLFLQGGVKSTVHIGLERVGGSGPWRIREHCCQARKWWRLVSTLIIAGMTRISFQIPSADEQSEIECGSRESTRPYLTSGSMLRWSLLEPGF